MITLIRNKIMGSHAYIMWAFVIILLLSVGAPSIIRQSSSGPWVLQINDQVVGYNTFVRTVQMEEQVARQKYGSESPLINPKVLYSQALDSLIYSELLDQSAIKAGISISPCYAATRISDPRFIIPILVQLQVLPAYNWNSGIDMRMLRKLLFEKGLTVQDFDKEVTKTLGRELVQYAVFIAGYSPLFEQESEYKKTELGKTITVVTIPLDNFIAIEQESGVTKQELQAFFDREKRKYSEPEKRSAIVWEFTPERFGTRITDQQIDSYYAKYKETVFVQDPVKIRVRRILLPLDSMSLAQKIKKEVDAHPESFADKVREHSIDTVSVSKGGLLQAFARGAHDMEFDKKAFLLSVPGAISDIITTKDGLEIIQLVERINKTYKPLHTVRSEIKDILALKQFNDAFDVESRRIIRQRDTKALDDFIQEHRATQISYKGVTRESSPFAQRFFGMKQDAPVAFMEDNKGYIMMVTAIEPSFTPPLSVVESRVSQDLFKQRAEKKLSELLQTLKIQTATIDLPAIAKQYKGNLHSFSNLKATDTDKITSYKNKDLALDKLLQLEKVGSVLTVQTATNGYLARLEAIEAFDTNVFNLSKTALRTSLNRENMQTTLMGFIASARRTATIKKNDALLMRS